MTRFRTFALAAILVGAANAADAHARLDHAAPAVGSTVATSLSEVTLYFSEALEPKFSGGEVRNAAGARVDHGQSVSGKAMHLSVGGLGAGRYTVTWHVLSVDTHKTEGNFSFTVGK